MIDDDDDDDDDVITIIILIHPTTLYATIYISLFLSWSHYITPSFLLIYFSVYYFL